MRVDQASTKIDFRSKASRCRFGSCSQRGTIPVRAREFYMTNPLDNYTLNHATQTFDAIDVPLCQVCFSKCSHPLVASKFRLLLPPQNHQMHIRPGARSEITSSACAFYSHGPAAPQDCNSSTATSRNISCRHSMPCLCKCGSGTVAVSVIRWNRRMLRGP